MAKLLGFESTYPKCEVKGQSDIKNIIRNVIIKFWTINNMISQYVCMRTGRDRSKNVFVNINLYGNSVRRCYMFS